MCKHDDTEESDPQPTSVLGRLTERRPRLANGVGLGFWIAAITVLILHANSVGPHSLSAFMFEDSWLIGAGCIGVPVLLFNLLGPRLSIRSLELIGAACFTGAVFLTVFVATGESHMATSTALFLFIMQFAMGIHALNGAYALDRNEMIAKRVRAEERAKAKLALEEAKRERDAAVEDAALAGIVQSFNAQHARAAELDTLLNSDTEDAEEPEGRHPRYPVNGHNGSAPILRLVAGDQSPLKATGTDQD